MVSEASSQYLQRIREDAAAVLGSGIALLGIEREELHGVVRLAIRYELAGVVHQTVATGETVVAAHAALREELALDRVRFGFESLVSRR